MADPEVDIFGLIDAAVRLTSKLRGVTLYPGLVQIPPANAQYDHLVNQVQLTDAALDAWLASGDRHDRRPLQRRQRTNHVPDPERRQGTARREPPDTDAVA